MKHSVRALACLALTPMALACAGVPDSARSPNGSEASSPAPDASFHRDDVDRDLERVRAVTEKFHDIAAQMAPARAAPSGKMGSSKNSAAISTAMPDTPTSRNRTNRGARCNREMADRPSLAADADSRNVENMGATRVNDGITPPKRRWD